LKIAFISSTHSGLMEFISSWKNRSSFAFFSSKTSHTNNTELVFSNGLL